MGAGAFLLPYKGEIDKAISQTALAAWTAIATLISAGFPFPALYPCLNTRKGRKGET